MIASAKVDRSPLISGKSAPDDPGGGWDNFTTDDVAVRL